MECVYVFVCLLACFVPKKHCWGVGGSSWEGCLSSSQRKKTRSDPVISQRLHLLTQAVSKHRVLEPVRSMTDEHYCQRIRENTDTSKP